MIGVGVSPAALADDRLPQRRWEEALRVAEPGVPTTPHLHADNRLTIAFNVILA